MSDSLSRNGRKSKRCQKKGFKVQMGILKQQKSVRESGRRRQRAQRAFELSLADMVDKGGKHAVKMSEIMIGFAKDDATYNSNHYNR